MSDELNIVRVCSCCGNTCTAVIKQKIYSKERTPDGTVSISHMDDVAVSECCNATYELWVGEQEVGSGTEGIDRLEPLNSF